MDDLDNVLVLTVFAASLVAVIVGFVLAWRSKRPTYRKAGLWAAAVVAGFAGLVILSWLIGAILPLPPPDGSPLWHSLVFVLVFSPLPCGAFYFCLRLVRQALRDEAN